MPNRPGAVVDFQESIRRWLTSDIGIESTASRTAQWIGVSNLDRLTLREQREIARSPAFRTASRTIYDYYSLGLEAPPYFVEASIADLLGQSARSLPEWTFDLTLFPTRDGCVYFGRPVELSTGNHLHGFSWCESTIGVPRKADAAEVMTTPYAAFEGHMDDEGMIQSDEVDYHPGAVVVFYCSDDNTFGFDSTVGPTGFSALLDGSSSTKMSDAIEKQRNTPAVENADSLQYKINIMGALLLFMRQRLMVATLEPVDRATRRRAERDNRKAPDIRVVRLRRAAYGSAQGTVGARPVEWQCQWLVGGETGGFWRQQACGPRHTQRAPVFILPHWKGPRNAPVKLPGKRAFVVDR